MVLNSLPMPQKVRLVALKVPLLDIYWFLAHIHSFNISIHIYYNKSGIFTKYFGRGQRFCGNLVSRFPVIIPPWYDIRVHFAPPPHPPHIYSAAING